MKRHQQIRSRSIGRRTGMKKLLPVLVIALSSVFMASGPAMAVDQVSRDINSYVIFAYGDLTASNYPALAIKGGSTADGTGYINGGNVGVNTIDAQPLNNNNVVMNVGANGDFVMSSGTQLVADTSRFDVGANVYNFFSNCANYPGGCAAQTGTVNNQWTTFTFATSTEAIIAANNLPTLPFDPARTSTNNTSTPNITTSTTLLPGTYGTVSTNNGITLTLQSGIYNMLNFDAGQNNTIITSPGTVLTIDGKFNLGDGSEFGSSNSVPWVYVGSEGVGSGTTIQFGENVLAYGHFLAPDGQLNSSRSVDLYGTFWANQIGLTDFNANFTFVPVPVPSTLLLLGSGLAGLLGIGRRSSRRR